MKSVKLPIEMREKTGSAESRRLRRRGRLPAVLYGLDRPQVNFSVDGHEFANHFHHGHRVFTLSVEGRTQLCLLKDIQFDTYGELLLHADFSRVDENVPVTLPVALNFVGAPEQVSGALVEFPNSDIHVTCRPKDIPESIDVTLTDLQVGQTITAGDVKLPEGLELDTPPETVMVTFHYRHAAVEAAEEEVAPEEAAEPEVLSDRKPDEESE